MSLISELSRLDHYLVRDKEMALPGTAKTRGIVLIMIGLWLLLLAWALYAKYERQTKVEKGASVPLVSYLAVSALVVAGGLWYEYRKRSSAMDGLDDSLGSA